MKISTTIKQDADNIDHANEYGSIMIFDDLNQNIIRINVNIYKWLAVINNLIITLDETNLKFCGEVDFEYDLESTEPIEGTNIIIGEYLNGKITIKHKNDIVYIENKNIFQKEFKKCFQSVYSYMITHAHKEQLLKWDTLRKEIDLIDCK